MSQRNGIFELRRLAKRIEVDSDAKRRANFILAAIALTDVAVVVPCNCGVYFLELCPHLARLRDEFGLVLQKRRDHRFHWSDFRRKGEIRTCVISHRIFPVRTCEYRKYCTVDAKRRLNDMRNKFFFRFFVEVRELSTGRIRMSGEIEVGTVCETPELLAAKGIVEFKINRALTVMRAVLCRNFKFVHTALWQADCRSKKMHHFPPLLERLFPLFRRNEILDFHL